MTHDPTRHIDAIDRYLDDIDGADAIFALFFLTLEERFLQTTDRPAACADPACCGWILARKDDEVRVEICAACRKPAHDAMDEHDFLKVVAAGLGLDPDLITNPTWPKTKEAAGLLEDRRRIAGLVRARRAGLPVATSARLPELIDALSRNRQTANEAEPPATEPPLGRSQPIRLSTLTKGNR